MASDTPRGLGERTPQPVEPAATAAATSPWWKNKQAQPRGLCPPGLSATAPSTAQCEQTQEGACLLLDASHPEAATWGLQSTGRSGREQTPRPGRSLSSAGTLGGTAPCTPTRQTPAARPHRPVLWAPAGPRQEPSNPRELLRATPRRSWGCCGVRGPGCSLDGSSVAACPFPTGRDPVTRCLCGRQRRAAPSPLRQATFPRAGRSHAGSQTRDDGPQGPLSSWDRGACPVGHREPHRSGHSRHGKSASGSPVTAHRTLHLAWGCASHRH